ncbi:hypothetical protein CC1G_08210 [Coprinopsis cinerea okayama7|uniref:Uncharacterized protein n=1 Tax=Coprinopsis cinerea (strain Okayama-7 / 130 / ATCC MYA-4618 / FGSC 9003) TaxID=240176 RepID=A8P7E5_COPC7|nr:hypothetical protein CC1G_08210 [Coprinopsis cinerea okayama7\|eukprot:XP_001839343.2 hypothetical protein CC1G_08210 [Coprinopsis cinerea okayama7\
MSLPLKNSNAQSTSSGTAGTELVTHPGRRPVLQLQFTTTEDYAKHGEDVKQWEETMRRWKLQEEARKQRENVPPRPSKRRRLSAPAPARVRVRARANLTSGIPTTTTLAQPAVTRTPQSCQPVAFPVAAPRPTGDDTQSATTAGAVGSSPRPAPARGDTHTPVTLQAAESIAPPVPNSPTPVATPTPRPATPAEVAASLIDTTTDIPNFDLPEWLRYLATPRPSSPAPYATVNPMAFAVFSPAPQRQDARDTCKKRTRTTRNANAATIIPIATPYNYNKFEVPVQVVDNVEDSSPIAIPDFLPDATSSFLTGPSAFNLTDEMPQLAFEDTNSDLGEAVSLGIDLFEYLADEMSQLAVEDTSPDLGEAEFIDSFLASFLNF